MTITSALESSRADGVRFQACVDEDAKRRGCRRRRRGCGRRALGGGLGRRGLLRQHARAERGGRERQRRTTNLHDEFLLDYGGHTL
jgi:hypothetical protein